MKAPSTIKVIAAPTRTGSRYPAPHNAPCMDRNKFLLGDVFGLSQFGVNLATLSPGTWSSQRHWHEKEDEFIYVIEGMITLCDDDGEHILSPGMCAGFKANSGNGHCLKNLSDKPATYIEIGSRIPNEKVIYNDIDMMTENSSGKYIYSRKDGTPY
jgi:uncharacterized cupin superfamily protein